jgi:hypothetical protein
MTEPTRGDYDISEVEGIDSLMSCLKEFNEFDTHKARVEFVAELLMNGHDGVSGYLTFGNNKVAKNTGIFNMNSATDCPNADSTESDQTDTGVCQVPWESCYAHKSENIYKDTLKKRRLQEYMWDNVDAVTFADALLRVKARKRSAFDYLRVSESGDFRHRGDIIKWDVIAERLQGEIQVYTYSASHKLDWSEAEHFTVNQSNGLADYGDRLFSAMSDAENIPDDAIFCPFEAAAQNGVETDSRPKCGECTACIEPESEQSRDVYITIH